MTLKLTPPKTTAIDAFNICIQNTNDYQRYLLACQDVTNDAAIFRSSFNPASLFTFHRRSITGPSITKDEMLFLYNQRLVRSKAGRVIYDEIFLGAKFGICAFCGVRDATTLDHYLAKSETPSLAVAPENLIPACIKCNSSAKASYPLKPEDQLIHAYFDDVESENWLKASIKQHLHTSPEPATVIFSVLRPPNWNDELFARMVNHFRTFELAKLYKLKAADLLSKRQYRLSAIFYNFGAEGVKKDLYVEFVSHQQKDINGFETATYHAGYQSSWFCSGGFGLVSKNRLPDALLKAVQI